MTPATIEPRSPRACAATLAYYRRHRAAHALPEGWDEDASGLEDAAEDLDQELEPIPYLGFDRIRRHGELSIDVDLYNHVTGAVFVTNFGRDVPTAEELADLLYMLLGIEIDAAEIGDPDPITESEHPDSEEVATPTDDAPAAPHPAVIGQSWSLCLPYPYPPSERLRIEGGTGR